MTLEYTPSPKTNRKSPRVGFAPIELLVLIYGAANVGRRNWALEYAFDHQSGSITSAQPLRCTIRLRLVKDSFRASTCLGRGRHKRRRNATIYAVSDGNGVTEIVT